MYSSRTSICARSTPLSYTSHLHFGLIYATRRARGLASKAPTHEPKSDTLWIVGSALVFGPALIYLLGPGSSVSATSHGDAHVDSHPSKHLAAPPPVTQVDAGIQPHEHVEVEPEAGGKDEAGSDQGDGDSLPETEVESAAAKTTPDITITAEGADTLQNKEVDKIDVKRPSQGEFRDTLEQDVQQFKAAKTAKVEEEQHSS
ncbi:hypothetical protein JB92DRAFT_2933580 [Gautieria morchelliformis]|nr:hypothetical protein JB92DRAFT_2933580 [Gautieria morchelliformis]